MRNDFLLSPAQRQTDVIPANYVRITLLRNEIPLRSSATHACGDNGFSSKVNNTDRQTVNPLTDLDQNFIRTYIHDDKTVYKILSIWLFKFLSYSVRMTSNMQTDRLPVDGFCPKFDRNLQIMFKGHIPNFIPVALIVFELSCSQRDIIPKLCFSDSGRSKTWRFVKISSSNFLTITILSLCILRIRESKKSPSSAGKKEWDNGEACRSVYNVFPEVKITPTPCQRPEIMFVTGTAHSRHILNNATSETAIPLDAETPYTMLQVACLQRHTT
ncbi:hypothetical protein AVEN_83931-1 [Araneus ventricosus]|uniref:Uncharacterized protein n=1 Tax=Araneus ventricosus TaxID=182803 RepID=A0A4Y2E9B5_ARAVE|nr:hypothetical protein AVEN_83931-1 [Araneus ventricosus]